MSSERPSNRRQFIGAALFAAVLLVAFGWLTLRNYELERRLIVHEARIRQLSRLEDSPYTDTMALSLKSGDDRTALKERLDARYRREARYKFFMEPLGFPLPSERTPAVHIHVGTASEVTNH